jgi:sulfate adenylyltransferase subunit 1 (EFTu-like GTPase family)
MRTIFYGNVSDFVVSFTGRVQRGFLRSGDLLKIKACGKGGEVKEMRWAG